MRQQMMLPIRLMMGVALLLGATLPSIGDAQASLVSAVLPGSRSVQVGTTATAFGILINGGTTTATSCSIAPSTSIPATFSYQTTDPLTNALTGSPNTPVDLPAGQSQTFIVSLTPTAEIPPTDVPLSFDCTNTDPAPSTVGLNTLLLSASATPVPDIVALVATPTNDGITHLPGATGGIGSTGVFVVASLNVGATGTITVTADTGTASLPLAITICQTNTGTGACLAPPSTTVTTDIVANTTPSFGVFVEGLGPIPFDPATNRIFIRFNDQGGITRGSTSVAVQTDGPPPLTITSTATLPPGTVNQLYSFTLTATGGTSPFLWNVIAGSLPGGLTLNASTGQISGTPTTAGTFTGTFQVQDTSIIPQAAQQTFSVTIASIQMGGGGPTNPSMPWVGNWIQVNFLSTDETEFDSDDLDGIGFSAIITETTWTEFDRGGCTVTYALSVNASNHYTKTATAVSGCPFGNEALPFLNETGRLEFEGDFMNEFFDLEPGDEISAFRWLRQ